jgi:hypothetical protein
VEFQVLVVRHVAHVQARHEAVDGRGLEGRMPGGIPIPVGGLMQVRGDWQWLVDCFRLRWFTADFFCWQCDASKHRDHELYFGDFRPTARHRGTRITQAEYFMRVQAEGQDPSTLFKSPGMEIDYLIVDSMHAGDLGVFADIIGSVLWLEISTKSWHKSVDEGMARLNADLKKYNAANQHLGLSSVFPLTVSQLKGRGDKHHSLKAKAAQCRHLAEFTLIIANRHKHGTNRRPPFRFVGRLRGHEDDHLSNMVSMCEGLCAYHRSCRAQPFDAEACKSAMYRCLHGLEVLHDLWRQDIPEAEHKYQPFTTKPKAHELQHMVEDKLPLWGSPSTFWCYRDEDFIGVVKIIAAKSCHPATLERRVIEKLLILANLGFRP